MRAQVVERQYAARPEAGLLVALRGRYRLWCHRERGDLGTAPFRDARRALFVHFVDANNGLQGNVASLHTRELVLELFLAGIDQNLGALTKHQFFYLDKTPHITLVDLTGKNLVDLTTIMENDLYMG